MSFQDLSYADRCERLLTTTRNLVILEIQAIQKTPWLPLHDQQTEILKAKGAYKVVKSIIAHLDKVPDVSHPEILRAWDAERDKITLYLARALATVKSRDLRVASLSKLIKGIEVQRKEFTDLDHSGLSSAEIDTKAQEIIGHINSTIGYIEFSLENPILLTGLASAIWNKTAVLIAQKMFGKTLSELTPIQAGKVMEKLAPILTKSDRICEATAKWLAKKGVNVAEERARALGYDLFGSTARNPQTEIETARIWLKDRLSTATRYISEAATAAGFFLDVVTVVLDGVGEVERWSSAVAKSAFQAYAVTGSAIVLNASLAEVTIGGGGALAEFSVMEAALAEIVLTLTDTSVAALASSEILPVAAFVLVTGVLIAVGMAAAAVVETLVDVFFGPQHIPAGLRANYAAPVSAAHLSTVVAPMRAA